MRAARCSPSPAVGTPSSLGGLRARRARGAGRGTPKVSVCGVFMFFDPPPLLRRPPLLASQTTSNYEKITTGAVPPFSASGGPCRPSGPSKNGSG
eukprot:6998632-Pyramimonas_sp.AAC.1